MTYREGSDQDPPKTEGPVNVQLLTPLETRIEPSPLQEARVVRGLSVEQVSVRSGLRVDEIEWLEEGRLYRFPSQSAAMLAAVVYATALGVDKAEARRLAGLPGHDNPFRVNPVARLLVTAALAALLSAVLVMVLMPGSKEHVRTVVAASDPNLPAPWKISVTVLNGSGDINWTRQVASRIGSMGYLISKVARADRFDYPTTAVYFEPGSDKLGIRLARQLGVATQTLPPGTHPRELVVIVGPQVGLAAG
jgi:transcriptional regulator with XRE-family HTH domain